MKLKYDELVSNFGFDFNLRPSTMARAEADAAAIAAAAAETPRSKTAARGVVTNAVARAEQSECDARELSAAFDEVGRCRLTSGSCS